MSSSIQFFARLPIDAETHFIPKTSIFAQTPKWYQFKLRSLINPGKRWLGCLGEEFGFTRKKMIIADEGGVGKTKSAGICVNYILNSEDTRPVLILVEPRQISAWLKKLKKVLPPHQKINIKGSAKRLQDPKPGIVYICSKYSLHENYEDLKKSWEGKDQIFSMLIIDECHKMKPGDYSKKNTISKNKSGRNYQAEKNVCELANYVIGVTASPLGIEKEDVWHIGKKLGIPERNMDFFKPNSKLTQVENEDLLQSWEKWAVLNYEDGFSKEIQHIYENYVTLNDLDWQKFVGKFGEKLADIIPIKSNSRSAFIDSLLAFDISNKDLLFELLSELNPFSPCICITTRDDLGKEASRIFRTMKVSTSTCKFDDETLESLSSIEDSNIAKQLHSHPNEYIYNQKETFSLSKEDNPVTDERVAKIIQQFQEVINLRKSECIGAVIFVEYLDTVNYLQNLLQQEWGKIDFEGKPNLIIQRITSQTYEEDYQSYIEEDEEYFPFSRIESQFHVVIGTSAIEQGVDMPWANLLIHWDLPYNPRRLEQRTWRLDRHNKDAYTDEFQVIYFWTGDERLESQISSLQERAKQYDKMLGRDTNLGLWPQTQTNEYVREYSGISKSFLHQEAEKLASAWHLAVSEDSDKLGIIQQKEIFRWIANTCNLELDEESLKKGQLRINFNLLEINSGKTKNSTPELKLPLNEMKKLALHADEHDHEAIAELSYYGNHYGNSWIGIDGFKRPTATDRSRIITINPTGKFVEKMLRIYDDNKSLEVNDKLGEHSFIFSIDPVDKAGNLLTIPNIQKLVFSEHDHCNLFINDLGVRELSHAKDNKWLLQLIETNEFSSITPTLNDIEKINLNQAKESVFGDLVNRSESKYNEYQDMIIQINDSIRDLGEITSLEEENREIELKRMIKFIEIRQKIIAEIMDNELSDKENYTVNVRMVR